MVYQVDTDDGHDVFDFLCLLHIRLGRGNIAGRMIVCQDDFARTGKKGDLSHFPGIDAARVQTTHGNAGESLQMVRFVQEEDVSGFFVHRVRVEAMIDKVTSHNYGRVADYFVLAHQSRSQFVVESCHFFQKFWLGRKPAPVKLRFLPFWLGLIPRSLP